tara:strand:+ start:2301 stop:2735 length:435 start_codon:yes stop_codon:yes gene_type:complete
MRSDYLNENSGATFGLKKKVEPITVARTLSNDDSGKVFRLDSAGGAYSITLPTASTGEDGVYYKLIVEEETPTAIITVAAGSAIISLVMKDAGGNASNSTAGTQVSNILIGTTAEKGDYVNLLFANGEWFAECMSSIDDAVTTS